MRSGKYLSGADLGRAPSGGDGAQHGAERAGAGGDARGGHHSAPRGLTLGGPHGAVAVATRNRNVADAQSRVISDAH